ncbi:hypothetical protein H257_04699 [Aphanomyces astaci]|uniref:Uncharacterized protein n=1 Tax=Aphanomyces astaci TaxID=112090 RepID=W4GV62_APHAT|nr:hypothetical protein H257_04699 [Aphanomyces astaci]ETV82929.1 hypothetical protein H257_04699 [Aphanomyces astaci]|eukprot:XP_009827600.1 hypothetical protein H257_04699 [Aphanomyces astaci]
MRGFTAVACFFAAAVLISQAQAKAKCPVTNPKSSKCWCNASMKVPRMVGKCDSTQKQNFHQSAQNAKNNGATFYLCCDKARAKSYCMTIAEAQACRWEQGIAFYP